MGLGDSRAQRGAVVLADQDHALGPQLAAQHPDQLYRVGQLLAGLEAGRIEGFAEGFARAAPVPLDHYEILFQTALEPMRQADESRAGAAMQEKDDGLGPVGAPDQDPLPRAAEGHRFELGDRVRAGDRRGEGRANPRRAGDQGAEHEADSQHRQGAKDARTAGSSGCHAPDPPYGPVSGWA